MSNRVEISVPGRLRTRTIRRDLPASWTEVPAARRISLLRPLLQDAGPRGQVQALREVLDVPGSVFKALEDDQVAALLALCPWMAVQPDPRPRIEYFEHRGTRYYLPSAHGMNLMAIEYPIADEAFLSFVRDGKPEGLTLLVATLCREQNPDGAAARTRGDQRMPLLTRWEAEARARDLADVPGEVAMIVLLYFAGVKEFVHRSYGAVLFEQEEPTPEREEKSLGLGWWGLYFQVAVDGPFGDVERVYQTPFHDVCMFLVDRIRQQKDRERQQQLASPDFGINNPKG